jgi:hypothetical protein
MSVDKKDFFHKVLHNLLYFSTLKEYTELNILGTFHPTFLQF